MDKPKKYVGSGSDGMDVTNMYNSSASLDTSTGDQAGGTNYGSSMQRFPVRTLMPSQDEINVRKDIADERGHSAQKARLEYREKKMQYNQDRRAGKFEQRKEKKLARLKSKEAGGSLKQIGRNKMERLESMGYGAEEAGPNMMAIDRAISRSEKKYSPRKMKD